MWVMDHFFQIEMIGAPEEDMHEGYTTLAYLAALTKRIKLGTLVTGAVYRHPGILVKTVTTLDVLSSGRAYLGIGAAWFEREALGLGVPYPPTGERFERLEEALQIAHQMWSGEVKPYHGKHYQLAEAMAHPQPLSRPHPPILIGGMGENKTMRIVARYGDACNLFAAYGVETLQGRLDIIKRNCDEIGRDYNEIERTSLGSIDFSKQTPAEVIDQCKQLAGIGIQHAIFNFARIDDPATLDNMIRVVIPAVAGL